jgi:hypothetical protein
LLLTQSDFYRERLSLLKQEIMTSGFTVREYGDLSSFREQIGQDLLAAISPVVESSKGVTDDCDRRGFITAVAGAQVELPGMRDFIEGVLGKGKSFF